MDFRWNRLVITGLSSAIQNDMRSPGLDLIDYKNRFKHETKTNNDNNPHKISHNSSFIHFFKILI